MISLLVGDSSAVFRRMVRAHLERSGLFRVQAEAETGEELLDLYHEIHPDVVLCEAEFADVDAVTIMRRLRERYTDAKVVVVTSQRDPAKLERVREAGCVEVVFKPVEPTTLVEALTRASQQTEADLARLVSDDGPASSLPRALVVEDDPTMRRLLTKVAESARFIVVAETDGAREAVALFEQHHPDLVLLDIGLPDGSGLEVLAEIRCITRDAVIIMCTSASEKRIVESAVNMGAAGYLVKPIVPQKAAAVIRERFAAARARAAQRFLKSG